MNGHVWIESGQFNGCDRHKKYMPAWANMTHHEKFSHALEYCQAVHGSAAELERLAEGMGGEISQGFQDALKEHRQKKKIESWYQSAAREATGPPEAAGPSSAAGKKSPPPPPPPRDALGGPDFLGAALPPPGFGAEDAAVTARAVETMRLSAVEGFETEMQTRGGGAWRRWSALMEKMEALTARMDRMVQMMDKKLETNAEYEEWLQLRSRSGSCNSGAEAPAAAGLGPVTD